MTLRLATHEDIPTVVDMALRFARVSPYAKHGIDQAEIEDIVRGLLTDRNKGIIVLYEVDGKPQGMIAGLLTKMLFSKDQIATELIWWVNPEHRSRKSLALKEAYEFWAKKVGARFIQMSSLADEKIERFYQRTGYDLVESAYLKIVGG